MSTRLKPWGSKVFREIPGRDEYLVWEEFEQIVSREIWGDPRCPGERRQRPQMSWIEKAETPDALDREDGDPRRPGEMWGSCQMPWREKRETLDTLEREDRDSRRSGDKGRDPRCPGQR